MAEASTTATPAAPAAHSERVYPLTAPPTPKHTKLGGYDFYKSIGSPQNVLAPMVDQSELVSGRRPPRPTSQRTSDPAC